MERQKLDQQDESHLLPSFRFDAVCVLESLPDIEPQTGSELFADVLQPAHERGRLGFISLPRARDRDEFLSCLAAIERDVLAHDLKLILDIEAHGASERDGIVIADGTLIPWSELRWFLTRINRATRNNLFVVLAACNGIQLIRAIRAGDRAPFFGWLGPDGEPSIAVTRAAVHEFFRALQETRVLDEAVRRMNSAAEREAMGSGASPPKFGYMTAGQVFDEVARQTQDQARGRAGQKWLEGIVTRARAAEAPALRHEGLTGFRRRAREFLRTIGRQHERQRRFFLWLDEFPENAKRYERGP